MGFEPHQPPSRFEAVNEFTDQMKDNLEEAKSALAKAKNDMAQYHNHCRSPAPSFSPGDMVYLDSEDIQTTRRRNSRTAILAPTRLKDASESTPTTDESLTSLAVYFRNWHMFREYMNNITC